MQISEQLLCLFSARVERRDGSYVVEIPERELDIGALSEGETYRMAALSTPSERTAGTDARPEPESESEPKSEPESGRERGPPTPPVEENETRRVEIEDIGEQGDGIARVERGYVVIVPDTEKGERVEVSITDVRENVAFARVVERLSYYE